MNTTQSLNSPIIFSPGVKVMLKDEQVILLNLLSSRWIRIPKHLYKLILAFIEGEAENEVARLNHTYQISREAIYKFMEVIKNEGYVQGKYMADINGIELINYHVKLRNENIAEKINFKRFTLEVKEFPKNKLYDILDKLKTNIKHATLYFDTIKNSHPALELINHSCDNFDSVSIIINVLDITPHLISQIKNKNKVTIIINGDTLNECCCSLNEIKEKLLNKRIPELLKSVTYCIKFSYNSLGNDCFFDQFLIFYGLEIPIIIASCFPTLKKKYIKTDSSRQITLFKKIVSQYLNGTSVHINNFDFGYYRYVKLSCGAGKSHIFVSHDGNIYPCAELIDDSFLLGNILDDTVAMIQMQSTEILKSENVRNYTQCNSCNTAFFCGGGCIARRHNNILDKGEDPMCKFISDMIAQNIWLFNEDITAKENLITILDNI